MISQLRIEVHNRCLDLRAMDRLVQSREFEEAFKLDPDNAFLKFAILSGNTYEVESWIKKTLSTEIGEMSLRNLRDLASRLGIPYYTTLPKSDLIVKIIQVQNDRRSQEVAC